MTQQQLAEAVGAHWITISKLERGKAQLTFEWQMNLAEALRVPTFRLLHKADKATIYVGGIVVDGEPTYFGSGEEEEGSPLEIDAHAKPHHWALVADDSLYPIFRAGDLVRFEPVLGTDSDPYESYLGRLCMVHTFQPDRWIFGVLEAGETAGRFTVRPLMGPPVKNFEDAILNVVTQAIFQPKLTKELQTHVKI